MEERVVDKELKITYLGNSLLNVGFRIAGIADSSVVSSTHDAEAKLRELFEKNDTGIIIMTSSVRRMVKDRRLNDLIQTSMLPTVIEIPEANEQVGEDDLRNLIMRAIGIDITKNV